MGNITDNKKKDSICWVTPECFLDVDLPIIISLNKQLSIYWIIIGFDRSSRGMYTRLEIEKTIEKYKLHGEILQQNYRFSNPMVLTFYTKLILKIRKLNHSIVYTSYLGEPFFLLLLPCFIKKRKVVLAYHDLLLHAGENHSTIKNIYHTICRKIFHNFHLFSNTQKDIFVKKHGNKNILTTPLVCKDFGEPICVKTSKITRFLFFGSILEYKGLDILLKAVEHLIHVLKETNFKLTIAGNANLQEWDKYKKLITNTEQINCDIRIIPNSEIPDLFCNNDILVLPYREATQSGPLLIAYNYGLPIIASDIPAFKEYITENTTGLFFQNKKYKDLAGVMLECIKNKQLIYELKNNVNTLTKVNYGIENISNKYLYYFNKLIE